MPNAPLVIPVMSDPAIPVYVINSSPTAIVPVVGKPVVDVKVIAVPIHLYPLYPRATLR